MPHCAVHPFNIYLLPKGSVLYLVTPQFSNLKILETQNGGGGVQTQVCLIAEPVFFQYRNVKAARMV